MARSLEHDQADIGNHSQIIVGKRQRNERVALAPDKQGRGQDRAELVEQRIVAEELCARAGKRAHARAERVTDEDAQEPRSHVPEGGRERQRIAGGVAPIEQARRRREHEAIDRFGPKRGDAGADGTAERVADEMRPLEADLRAHGAEVGGRVTEDERPAARGTEPGQVDQIEVEPRRERLNDPLPPAPGAREAVDEHRGRAGARDAVAHRDAADFALALLEHERGGVRFLAPGNGTPVLARVLYRGAPDRLAARFRRVARMRVYERYAERERAPIVTFVRGIGVSGRYFLPTAGRVAARCSVYVPDLPGFGRSGRLPGRATVRSLADALEAWLDAAELERPDAFVANSFGCQLAVDLAARRPERVGRLVLVGPTVDVRARSLTRQAARLALDSTREPPALWALEALDYAVHVAKSGLAGFVEMVRDPVELKLAQVHAPTLVVRGARDVIVPRAWASDVAAALPRGRLVEIPGSPHAVNYAAPEALARLTLEFLSERSRASSSTSGT